MDRATDLATALDHIPHLFDQLTEHLPNTPNPNHGERTTTSRHHPLPYRDNVSVARINLETLLVSWARLVSDKQGISAPQPNALAVVEYLVRHLSWIVDQDFMPIMCDEIEEAMDSATHTITDHTHTLTIGSCPAPTVSGEPCTGVLMVTPNDRQVVCPRCGEDWQASEWPRLGALLGCEPVGLVDAYAGAARLHDLGFTITPATIRKWAERGKVGRKGKGARKRVLYDLADLVSVAQQSVSA